MAAGGGQGDSGGVGSYLAIRRLRHAFLTGVLREGRHPRDLSHNPRADLSWLCPPSSTEPLLEVGFSDDGRLIADSDLGLGHLIDIACHGCWAAGGSVNVDKLAAFKICAENGTLRYRPGHVLTLVGDLTYKTAGLFLVGIPLVMGEAPKAAIRTTLTRLKLIHASLCRLHPSYILSLRIVSAFAIAKLDYIFEAIPPHYSQLALVQRAVDRTLRSVLSLPRAAPHCLLYAPLLSGGLGFPNLQSRFKLRFLAGVVKAINSRNHLVRQTTRWLVSNPSAIQVHQSDVTVLLTMLREHDLHISLPPHRLLVSAEERDDVIRPWTHSCVVLMSDGSVTARTIGWGCVVADTSGILATSHGGLACQFATSWAAEWIGKIAAVRLALRLGVPKTHMTWSIADNISAVHGGSQALSLIS